MYSNMLTMNALCMTCFLAVLALSNAQMSREQLRTAISNIDPMFAHRRDSPMPVSQNTNINLPVDSISPVESAAEAAVAKEELRSAISNIDPVFAHGRDSPMPVSQNTNINFPVDNISPVESAAAVVVAAEMSDGVAEVSIQADAPTAAPPKEPRPVTTPQPKIPKAPTGAVVSVRKNVRVKPIVHARVQPKTATPQTTVAATTAQTTKPLQDKQVTHEAVTSSIETTQANPNQCSLKIPYPDPSRTPSSDQCPTHIFVGRDTKPDLFISTLENQTKAPLTKSFLNRISNKISLDEFDKKCLDPVFNNHFLGEEACRSRENAVYLQWLLYLRVQLGHM